MNHVIRIALPFLLLGILFALATVSFSVSHETQKTTEAIVEKSRLMAKLTTTAQCFVSAIISSYQVCSEKKQELAQLVEKRGSLLSYQWYLHLAFLVIASMLLLYPFIAFESCELTVLHWVAVSMICLMVGLFAPFMQIVVYKDIPILDKMIGNVVVEYAAKSVYTAIQGLFLSGNTVVAIVTMFFSIVTPVLKSIAMGVLVFTGNGMINSSVLSFIKLIGPWSMAEVFVAAILISIFGLEQNELTKSTIYAGFYFFVAYVLISISASRILLKCKQE